VHKKPKLHPRNKHKNGYIFEELLDIEPELFQHITTNKKGEKTIDFFNPEAVKLLNAALLKKDYGIAFWDIPTGHLCPPIPGRADYIHHLGDLIGQHGHRHILDIGTGANCIYPILGVCEYDWDFTATDVDPSSLKTARAIVQFNPQLTQKVRLIEQPNTNHIFKHVVSTEDYFDATICNPPFFSSQEEADLANRRKVKKLTGTRPKQAQYNFGGKQNELWYPGGEKAFINQMIQESYLFKQQVGWFTTLVSKESSLKPLAALLQSKQAEHRIIEMGQGNKKSRILVWRF
jgi:23S rRNA (adenine1618-N6)-methyltransferase